MKRKGIDHEVSNPTEKFPQQLQLQPNVLGDAWVGHEVANTPQTSPLSLISPLPASLFQGSCLILQKLLRVSSGRVCSLESGSFPITWQRGLSTYKANKSKILRQLFWVLLVDPPCLREREMERCDSKKSRWQGWGTAGGRDGEQQASGTVRQEHNSQTMPAAPRKGQRLDRDWTETSKGQIEILKLTETKVIGTRKLTGLKLTKTRTFCRGPQTF